eukprot:jgi/Mesen1/4488/ME000228S03437
MATRMRCRLSSLILIAVIHFLATTQCGAQTDAELEFLTWLHKHGVKGVLPGADSRLAISRPVEVADSETDADDDEAEGVGPAFEGERGVIATEDIEEGEVLVVVPLNVTMALAPDDPEPFAGSGKGLALMALLLREVAKGKESFWWPYIRILPPVLPMPWLSLPQEQWREVQHAPTIRRLQAFHLHLRNLHRDSDPRAIAHATFEQYSWAMAMHFTRHFVLYVPPREGHQNASEHEERYLFMPFGDLFNHYQESDDDDGNVKWEDGLYTDRVEVRATRRIPRGTQVLEVYGRYPAEDFYLFQGFIPENGFRDTVVIFESMEEAVFWLLRYGAAQEWWSLHDDDGGDEDPWVATNALREARSAAQAAMQEEDPSWDEDAYLGTDWYVGGNAFLEPHRAIHIGWEWDHSTRVLAAFAAVYGMMGPSHGFMLSADEDALKKEGIAAAKQALAARCRSLLESFPTTIEEDLAILEGDDGERGTCAFTEGGKKCGVTGELSEALRLAIKFRMLQKTKLKHLLEMP